MIFMFFFVQLITATKIIYKQIDVLVVFLEGVNNLAIAYREACSQIYIL
jgi:hypothetical protein